MPRRESRQRALWGCARWESPTRFPKKLSVLRELRLSLAVLQTGQLRPSGWCLSKREEGGAFNIWHLTLFICHLRCDKALVVAFGSRYLVLSSWFLCMTRSTERM